MGSSAPKTPHQQPAWASVLAQSVDEAKETKKGQRKIPVPTHKEDEGSL